MLDQLEVRRNDDGRCRTVACPPSVKVTSGLQQASSAVLLPSLEATRQLWWQDSKAIVKLQLDPASS